MQEGKNAIETLSGRYCSLEDAYIANLTRSLNDFVMVCRSIKKIT